VVKGRREEPHPHPHPITGGGVRGREGVAPVDRCRLIGSTIQKALLRPTVRNKNN
jgi:hypothetical protein